MSGKQRSPGSPDLVGRDFARSRPLPSKGRTTGLVWLVGAATICALGLSALRIDILRVRYALGNAVKLEKELLQQQKRHTARLESLRDPARLASVARKRGFARPERVIEIKAAIGSQRP